MFYYYPAAVNVSSLENANTGVQGYHDTASNRSNLRFAHPPPVSHQHHNYHFPTLPMQGVRGHGISFHPPVTATTYRGVPSNSPPNNFHPPGMPRHVNPAPSGSQRMHRSRRVVLPNTSLRHNISVPASFLHVDVSSPNSVIFFCCL